MRKRTFAVLVLFWAMLSATIWTTFVPMASDWITPRLAGFDPQRAALIATMAAHAFPLFVAALVVLLMVLLARSAPAEQTRPATTRSAVDHRASKQGSKIICIKPDKILVNSGLRFGLLPVANGEAHGLGDGARKREIYFKKLDDRGKLMARVPYDGQHGLQFKCFVDYKGTKFEQVRNALSASGYKSVTPKAGTRFRAWFLLPDYKIDKTVEGQANTIRSI